MLIYIYMYNVCVCVCVCVCIMIVVHQSAVGSRNRIGNGGSLMLLVLNI